jgi:hypothetical protein
MKHETSDDCWCNPTNIPVERTDGSIGWVIAHNEPNEPPEKQVQRALKIFEAIEEVRNYDPGKPDPA